MSDATRTDAPSGTALLCAVSAASVRVAREARARRERERAARDARVISHVPASDPRRGRTPLPPGVSETIEHDKRTPIPMPARVNAPDADAWALAARTGGPWLAPTDSGWRTFAPAPDAPTRPLPDVPARVGVPAPAPAPRVAPAMTREDWQETRAPHDAPYVPAPARDPYCHACATRHVPGAVPWHA